MPAPPGRWKVGAGNESRGRIALGSLLVSPGHGSFGRAIPVHLDEVTRVSVVELGGD